MESSLVSAGHNIQHSYVKEEHSYVREEHSYVKEEHSYVREERSTFSDCFDGKYSLPPNLEKDMELNLLNEILPITDSCCNIPMETGSQQTSSAWDVDCTGVEASKSAAYQSMNVLHDDMPMTTYDANMPLQSTTNVNPTQVDDWNKRQNQTVVSGDFVNQINAHLFNATPSNAPNDPTIDYLIDVYDVLPATGEQNIPDSFCNTPIETGSQQEQVVAKDEDPEFKELADQVLDMEYEKRESMYKTEEVNVYGRKLSSLGQNIPDSFCNTPMETGSQQTQVVDPECKKCHQRAKQLGEKYKPTLPTIGREQPLKRFYSRMPIEPCLGACIKTPNVSVLHNRNCVLHNRLLLQELQNKNPKILQPVKEHLTNINMDRDDFKNLLFHEKLSKMLDKIECALAYIESCCDKYIYLLVFKLQLTKLVEGGINPLTKLVEGGINPHHNPTPVFKFLYHMKKKITDVDELILDLMQKDMSYYQLKVDLNNMLDMMSHHEYAEVGESYYHGLKLESRIDTFIENYKKVSESVKEKLDIQNNYTDCESISFYYKDYKKYLNLLINSLDETNSVPNNNSGFVDYPIISNPHLTEFYNKMDQSYYSRLRKQNRKSCQLTTTSDICLFMKDLSRLLDSTEELHVELKNTLEILSNSKQSDHDVYWFKDSLENAIQQILYYCTSEQNKTYLSVKELGRMEMKNTLGRIKMNKLWVYRNTKGPIKAYSLRCMKMSMWLSLLRGDKACKTVKESLSSICKELWSEFQFLEEYIDYNKAVIDVLKEKWFPQKQKT